MAVARDIFELIVARHDEQRIMTELRGVKRVNLQQFLMVLEGKQIREEMFDSMKYALFLEIGVKPKKTEEEKLCILSTLDQQTDPM